MSLPTIEERIEEPLQALEVIAVQILLHMLLRKASEDSLILGSLSACAA